MNSFLVCESMPMFRRDVGEGREVNLSIVSASARNSLLIHAIWGARLTRISSSAVVR
jgi:hypothetical protein